MIIEPKNLFLKIEHFCTTWEFTFFVAATLRDICTGEKTLVKFVCPSTIFNFFWNLFCSQFFWYSLCCPSEYFSSSGFFSFQLFPQEKLWYSLCCSLGFFSFFSGFFSFLFYCHRKNFVIVCFALCNLLLWCFMSVKADSRRGGSGWGVDGEIINQGTSNTWDTPIALIT